MTSTNNFLVTVADAVLRDPNDSLKGLMYAKALIDSGFTVSTEATEVRGGKNNPILYIYYHDRKIAVKLTDAVFDPNIIALNAGTTILNSTVTALKTDCLVLSASGSATLTSTPTSTNVEVFLSDGSVVTTAAGSTISIPSAGGDKVTAVYEYSATADQITFQTTTPPSVVDLTLLAEERDANNAIVNTVQIHIPQFQISGNYEMALTANGVSNQVIDGVALASSSTDCTTGDYYAKVTLVPYTGATAAVWGIAATPAEMSYSVAAGLPQSKQITTYGLRGGLQGNINVTTSASYAVTSGSTTLAAYWNVGLHTGLVTAGSSVGAGWTAVVTASYLDTTYGLLHDTVTLTATA